MSTYVIDANNQMSETIFRDYERDRGSVQNIAGQMYQAIVRAEAAYANFEVQLANEFAPLADYHHAKQAPVSDAVLLLRSKMVEVTALMEAMNAAMPAGIVLFPSVPGSKQQEGD